MSDIFEANATGRLGPMTETTRARAERLAAERWPGLDPDEPTTHAIRLVLREGFTEGYLARDAESVRDRASESNTTLQDETDD